MPTGWRPVLPATSATPRQDAYLAWAQATGFADGQPQRVGRDWTWVWLLLELKAQTTAAQFQQACAASGTGWIDVAPHHGRPPKRLQAFRFCTARVSPGFLRALQHPDEAGPPVAALVSSIERFEIGFACAAHEAGPAAWPAEKIKPTYPAVVVGVIDDGLAFAHARFSRRVGRRWRTRLLTMWDQGAEQVATEPLWGYGRVHTGKQIDGWLHAATDAAGRVDETCVYRDAGYREARHRVTHGTHVMDLACGADPGSEAAAPAIVAVQMPPVAVADTSCASMTPFMLDAMLHVLHQADASWGQKEGVCPTVINMSMGNIAGPHDGSSILESALDALIDLRRGATPDTPEGEPRLCNVVLPEGNSLQSQTHAWAQLGPGAELALDWIIKPDDGTSSFLELWMRPVGGKPGDAEALAFTVTLQPPGGLPAVTLSLVPGGPATQQQALRAGGNTLAMAGVHRTPGNGRYPMALMTAAPTAPYGPWAHAAPCGPWKLTLRAEKGSPHFYCNAYVQRDDTAFGRRGRGRQGVLYDGLYERYGPRGEKLLADVLDETGAPRAYVRRVGTINALATGKRVQVAGGLVRGPRRSDWRAALRYSSVAIPATPEWKQQTRYMALTEDSAVLHGICAAGTSSGSRALLSGTSMAAPQLTRAITAWLMTPGAVAGAMSKAAAFAADLAADANETLRPRLLPAPDLEVQSGRRRGPRPP